MTSLSLVLAAAPANAAGAPPFIMQILPLLLLGVVFWFLIIRPQMRRQKAHQAMVAALKKGDRVVTAGGLVGKVVRVDETQVELELAQGVRVKAVRHTIGEVLPVGGDKPAND